METVFNLTLVGLTIVAFYFALQPRYLFMVRIEEGVPRVAKGKVSPAFLAEISEVCAQAKVPRGWVGGLRRGKRVVLAFSRTIPAAVQQRLRNLWMLS
jgi:hypothetical protein